MCSGVPGSRLWPPFSTRVYALTLLTMTVFFSGAQDDSMFQVMRPTNPLIVNIVCFLDGKVTDKRICIYVM